MTKKDFINVAQGLRNGAIWNNFGEPANDYVEICSQVALKLQDLYENFNYDVFMDFCLKGDE